MLRELLALLGAPLGLHAAPLAAMPQDPPRWAVVMVQDAHGKVAGATGVLIPDPDREVPALGAVLAFDPTRRPGPDGGQPDLLWAKPSRQTGMLKWQFGETPRAGAAWISGDGSALLLPRLVPGDAQRATLVAEGAISTASGDVTCVLYATALVAGQRIPIPALQGTRFPLPPATYEAWVDVDGEIFWQRLTVASGATATIDLSGPSLVVERGADATVIPSGRSDLVLLGPDRARCTLRGAAAQGRFTAFVPGTGLVLDGRSIPPDTTAPTGPTVFPSPAVVEAHPPMEHAVVLPEDTPPQSIRGFVLTRNLTGWRLLGSNTVTEDGTLRLADIGPGDNWLLVAAPDHALLAVPIVDVGRRPLAIPRGLPLTVDCRLENGDPARDVRLEFVPRGAEVATVAVHADRRGRADFGRVTGPGTLRSSDAAYGNVAIELDAIPTDGVSLTIPTGFEVRGVVALPDGTPAAGVTVTLRALHDGLRPPARSMVTGDDGTFAFGGLTEDHDYLVFATTRRDGRTWSSQVGRFLATEQVLKLTIENEDPSLGPAK